jgi:hypothetical protein
VRLSAGVGALLFDDVDRVCPGSLGLSAAIFAFYTPRYRDFNTNYPQFFAVPVPDAKLLPAL